MEPLANAEEGHLFPELCLKTSLNHLEQFT